MPKPTITTMHQIEYVLETEAVLHIISVEGGKSYKTIRFPKGTEVLIYVSKLPIEEHQ